MKSWICSALLLLAALSPSGCGFGGLTDTTTAGGSTGSTESDTEVTGVVSKGIFRTGTVEIYAVADGEQQEVLLKKASIGPFGNYSATVRTAKEFKGVILIKAYGSYMDEATGTQLIVPPTAPLRAAVTRSSGDLLTMVTPLTELAVRKALGTGTTLSAAEVTAANGLVSELFKVDIVATEPVQPDLSDDGFGNAATSQEQKDYTLALAAVSQLASDSGALSDALAVLFKTVTTDGGSTDGAVAFKNSLGKFLASDRNLTGLTDVAQTNLAGVGGTSQEVKLKLAGKLPSGSTVNGVTLTLNLPAGVTVKGDYVSPQVVPTLEGVVAPSGLAATGSYAEGRYFPAAETSPGKVRLSIINASGMFLGEFVTVRCEAGPGVAPQPGEYTVSEFTAKDGNGGTLQGIDVERPLTVN